MPSACVSRVPRLARWLPRSAGAGIIGDACPRRWIYWTIWMLDHPISGECVFAELPQVLAELSQSPAGVLCQRIVYAGAG